jgi:hypothetical protein
MPTLKPLFGPKTVITISLNSLANGAGVTSSAIDNSTNRFQDFLIDVTIDGTTATNAWLQVLLVPSLDGTAFASTNSSIPIGIIDLSTTTPQRGIFSLSNALFQAPKDFKIIVINRTGAVLAASGNSANYQGINVESV